MRPGPAKKAALAALVSHQVPNYSPIFDPIRSPFQHLFRTLCLFSCLSCRRQQTGLPLLPCIVFSKLIVHLTKVTCAGSMSERSHLSSLRNVKKIEHSFREVSPSYPLLQRHVKQHTSTLFQRLQNIKHCLT